MNEKTDLVFCEVQKFSLWLRVIFAASMMVIVGFLIFALNKIPAQTSTPIPPTALTIVGIVISITVAAIFLIAKLQTEVRVDGLYVRYFPFHLSFKKLGSHDIAQCRPTTYKPLLEYGGWGIRYGKSGKAYNVSGNEGVQLIFKNGKRLLIGSQKSEELAKAIQTITQND